MSDQLQLVDVPETPRLTDRQQRALDAIVAAGYDGLHTDELGAILHADKHDPDDRCMWCGSTGNDVGKALRAKGLAQQRRRRNAGGDVYTVWTVAGKLVQPRDRSGEDIPF